MTVLLIAEDDDDIRSVLERIFSRRGFSVLTARDGVSALRVAAEERPDVILTDLDMPGLTGLELCLAVRDDPAIGDIPIAIVSGSLLPGDQRAIDAHACGVVLKPFDNKRLVADVERLASGGRHQHRVSPSPCPLKGAESPSIL